MPCARQSGRYRTIVFLGGRGCARVSQLLVLTRGFAFKFHRFSRLSTVSHSSHRFHCENWCEIVRAHSMAHSFHSEVTVNSLRNVKCEISHHEPCRSARARATHTHRIGYGKAILSPGCMSPRTFSIFSSLDIPTWSLYTLPRVSAARTGSGALSALSALRQLAYWLHRIGF